MKKALLSLLLALVAVSANAQLYNYPSRAINASAVTNLGGSNRVAITNSSGLLTTSADLNFTTSPTAGFSLMGVNTPVLAGTALNVSGTVSGTAFNANVPDSSNVMQWRRTGANGTTFTINFAGGRFNLVSATGTTPGISIGSTGVFVGTPIVGDALSNASVMLQVSGASIISTSSAYGLMVSSTGPQLSFGAAGSNPILMSQSGGSTFSITNGSVNFYSNATKNAFGFNVNPPVLSNSTQISGVLVVKGAGTGSYIQISASAAGITPTTCAANTEGGIAYSFTNHYGCVCDGTSWKQMGAPASACTF